MAVKTPFATSPDEIFFGTASVGLDAPNWTPTLLL